LTTDRPIRERGRLPLISDARPHEPVMIHCSRRPNPRAEYRLQRNARVNSSQNLAEKFPGLKNVSASLEYFDADGTTRNAAITSKLNVEHAKSIIWFNCVHVDCVGGDFDLTKELEQAISSRRKSVRGEIRCEGIRHYKDLRESAPCGSILRYKLTLGY